MSRLNATIKLLFACGELLFLFASLLCVLTSGIVYSGHIPAFAFPLAKKTSIIVLLVSGAALICSCFGCCAVLRQKKRRGCFSGRRMLCLHLLLLVSILFFGIVQMRFLETQELRMAAVIEDKDSFPKYNAFERHVNKYVNNLYFEILSSDSLEGSSAAAADWLVKFVEDKCPKRMSHEHCSALETRANNCDFSLKSCCPDENVCSSGVKEACPYENCREEILGQLYELLVPMRIGAFCVCVLSVLMLALSCLLICYNKRDEIEMELLKGGNISEEDIEAIRRLKSNKTIDMEQLEAPRFGSRKRHVKVSPAELA
eukprot:scaffold24884_cov174-Skeletonema_marinoi.AAC.4